MAEINMTREEAEAAFNALQGARYDAVQNIRKAQRARTWTQALKDATIANETANLAAFEMLQEKIGEAFHIGGY